MWLTDVVAHITQWNVTREHFPKVSNYGFIFS
jgi:hypothetical protein